MKQCLNCGWGGRHAVGSCILLVGLALVLGAMSPPVDAREFTDVRFIRLSNGIRLVVRKVPSPLVAVVVSVRGGSAVEPPGANGVAHLLEHLVFRTANPKLSPLVQLELLGGYVNADTSRDYTSFYAVVPARNGELAMRILSNAMANPSFKNEAVDFEKRIVSLELMQLRESDAFVCKELAERRLYGDHPYGRPFGGQPEGVAGLTPARAKSFHNAHYRAANISVIVVGGLNIECVAKTAEKAFSNLPLGAQVVKADLQAGKVTKQIRPLEVGLASSGVEVVNLAFRAVGFPHPDSAATEIIATYLGEGPTGRLLTAFKRARLRTSESIRVEYLTQAQSSAINITCFARRRDHGKIEKIVLSELNMLKALPIDEVMLTRCKRQLTRLHFEQTNTVLGQAQLLAKAEAMGGYQLAGAWLENVQAVTAQDIMHVARRTFTNDGYVVSALLPPESQFGEP